jgi:CubicO group peptidase (beta-lactamase class C family)
MLFTQGKTECKPSEAGYNEQRLEVLNKHLQSGIDAGEIQCATYCLSRRGKVFAHGALGKKSFREDDNTPAQPDSTRYVASVTKTFTAVAIMKLVEDGLTRLDVPVSEILPQFNTKPYNQINLFQLLTHTSGMHSDHGCFDNEYQTNYWEIVGNAYKLCENKDEFDWIAAALGTIGGGLRVQPNTEWGYCSFGFAILGAVIEKLTGLHAHKYIEEMICKPLGMSDTFFWENLTPDMAKRYLVNDEKQEKRISNIIEGIPEAEEDTPWNRFKIPSTSGGLNGTAYDLVRFGNMVLHGGTFGGARILGRKTVEKMTKLSIQLPDYCWNAGGAIRGYAIGFDHRNGCQFTFSDSTVMHEGAGACAMYIDPEEELVAAWIVPLAKEGWFPRIQYSTANVIWSGLM